jgi:hypothetical protein
MITTTAAAAASVAIRPVITIFFFHSGAPPPSVGQHGSRSLIYFSSFFLDHFPEQKGHVDGEY